MTKLFKALGVILVAIVAAYFFLIDGIIKSQLERHGTIALQAPLDIGDVTFHLFPTSLTLHDVDIGNARVPTHNLVQAETLTLPLSLRDLLAHKLIIDTLDVHGLRFHRPRIAQSGDMPAHATRTTNSPQLRDTLQRAQQMLNHPLASNTLDPNISITGAMLGEQFKPLLTQITTALNSLVTAPDDLGDWQILARRINIDGTLDFGSSNSSDNALRFTGTIDNVTPQPKLFDSVMAIDVRNAADEPAALQISGSIDQRKLAQAALRFDLGNFSLAQWPLSTDPELKIIVLSAKTTIKAMLSLTGNQFDLNALMHFQKAQFDIATGSDEIARAVADVWRRTNAFDINFQASGDVADPVVKLNSSLDVPLANAIQQLRPATTFVPATFPPSP